MALTKEGVVNLAIHIILDNLHKKKNKKCSSRYAKFLYTSTKDAKENHE